MKLTVEPHNPHSTPRGIDLTPVDDIPIATFGAAILAGVINAGGEMKAQLLVPFAQVPNAMPVFQFVGGVVFEITVRRVPSDQLPKAGWK